MSAEIVITKDGFKLPEDTGGKLTAVSLDLPHGLGFERWKDIGDTLKKVEGSILWWWGDWWVFGEHEYGERASQAADPGEDGFKFQTLMNAGWVSRKIETSRRREVLPWSFHAEVAGHSAQEQDLLLGWAEENNPTRKEFRAEVNRRKTLKRRQDIELVSTDPSLPLGRRFPIIYADPPWQYENPVLFNAVRNAMIVNWGWDTDAHGRRIDE